MLVAQKPLTYLSRQSNDLCFAKQLARLRPNPLHSVAQGFRAWAARDPWGFYACDLIFSFGSALLAVKEAAVAFGSADPNLFAVNVIRPKPHVPAYDFPMRCCANHAAASYLSPFGNLDTSKDVWHVVNHGTERPNTFGVSRDTRRMIASDAPPKAA